MSEQVQLSSPIEIKDNSRERVAFDLMNKIAHHDAKADAGTKDRKYWLTLYSQCLKATSGTGINYILQEE